MPLFFFLGGCFVKNEPNMLFVYKRIRTLIIPFLFFYGASLICKVGIKYIETRSFDFVGDLQFYSISNINYPLWFIISLFFSTLLLHFILKMKHAWAYALSTFAIGLTLFYIHLELPIWISQSILVCSFLYLGKEYYLKIRNNDKVHKLTLWGGVILTCPFFIYAGISNLKVDLGGFALPSNPIFFLFSAICGIGLTLLLSLWLSKTNIGKLLANLGLYSLFIYGLHANSSFLNPIVEYTTEILNFNLMPVHVLCGIVKTIYCTILFYFIGTLLKRWFPYLFGYMPNDHILLKLKTKKI